MQEERKINYDEIVLNHQFRFIGTVFLKHTRRKGWFIQMSMYTRPGFLVFCNRQGKGKGPQKGVEQILGNWVAGNAIRPFVAGIFDLKPGCSYEEAITSAQATIDHVFENAQWMWANPNKDIPNPSYSYEEKLVDKLIKGIK